MDNVMDLNSVLVVTQIPIIQEQLLSVKENVAERLSVAFGKKCTEDTVKELKKLRADLNKEKTAFEDRRKEIKAQIMQPYEDMNDVYKDCISTPYDNAIAELGKGITKYEDSIKKSREDELRQYFNELCTEKGIDFVKYEQIGVKVTLSASMKSLKEGISVIVGKVAADTAVIKTQPNSDEIMVEYKRDLNINNAILAVQNRHKAIEAEQARKEAEKKRQEAAQSVAEKVNEVLKETPLAPPVEVTPPIEVAPETSADNEPVFRTTFTITATKSKLIALREFLNNGGYGYECK